MNKFMFLFIFMCILLISIGYSALNVNLTISGNALVIKEPEIKITNVYQKSNENGGYETFDSTFDNNISNMNITLPNQDSKVTLIVEVTNETERNYKLESVIQLLSSNFIIQYEIKDKEFIHFNSNSVTNIEITFSYKYMMGTDKIIILNLEYIFEEVPYSKLEEIIFSGDDFIDTGVMNTGDYIFKSEIKTTGYNLNDGGWIFCGRTNYNYTLGVFVGKSGVFNSYGGTTSSNLPNLTLGTWYELYFSRYEHTFGSYSYTVTGQKLIPTTYERTILLGGATISWDGTVDKRHFIGSIKYFIIENAVSNQIIRYYIPVKLDYNNEIGFYELVEDKFYGNDGFGIFDEI